MTPIVTFFGFKELISFHKTCTLDHNASSAHHVAYPRNIKIFPKCIEVASFLKLCLLYYATFASEFTLSLLTPNNHSLSSLFFPSFERDTTGRSPVFLWCSLYWKIKYVSRLQYLWDDIKKGELEIPEFVQKHDDILERRPLTDYGIEPDPLHLSQMPPTAYSFGRHDSGWSSREYMS